MTQERDMTTTRQDQSSQIFHPRFAAFYERCKRYTDRGPLATRKVSHFPQASAILERNFKKAEGKKGVSRGTSR